MIEMDNHMRRDVVPIKLRVNDWSQRMSYGAEKRGNFVV